MVMAVTISCPFRKIGQRAFLNHPDLGLAAEMIEARHRAGQSRVIGIWGYQEF